MRGPGRVAGSLRLASDEHEREHGDEDDDYADEQELNLAAAVFGSAAAAADVVVVVTHFGCATRCVMFNNRLGDSALPHRRRR